MISKVPGARDLAGESWASLDGLARKLEAFFASRGYQRVETPLLEPTELFLRKSGGELASQLCSFTDPAGWQVSLRPEYTASVIRAYIESQDSLALPRRWQYWGPVFRYEGSYRQFTQQGLELLGASGREADDEVLPLACRGLREAGLKAFSLVLGHVGLVTGLLQSLGLSERTRAALLAGLAELRRNPGLDLRQRLSQQGLGATSAGSELPAGLLANGVLRHLMAAQGPTGSRTEEEILERFLEKVQGRDDPGALEKGLELVTRLAELHGPPKATLASLEALTRKLGLDSALVEDLRQEASHLSLEGANVTVDLGLARGLAYYTGLVFELYAAGKGPSLGGGGRYDGLVQALGGRSTPAIGFAYRLESVLGAR